MILLCCVDFCGDAIKYNSCMCTHCFLEFEGLFLQTEANLARKQLAHNCNPTWVTQARKQHESLQKHVPSRSDEWQRVVLRSLIGLPQLAAQMETVWRKAVKLNFLPSNTEATRRPLHTFLHPDTLFITVCSKADKGTVLYSMVWTKMIISLWDNLDGLK